MKKFLFVLLVLSGLQHKTSSAPLVEFTVVPGWATTGLLEGKVHNTTLYDHGIAVYIYIAEAGGWWIKPTSSEPLTVIQTDSSFSANIVTGGMIAKLKSLGKAGEKMTKGGAVILDGMDPNAILAEILSDRGSGTLVRRDVSRLKVVDAPKP